MKTINGNCPQFEENEISFVLSSDPTAVGQANPKLREWAESRRCVGCDHLAGSDKTFCSLLKIDFCEFDAWPTTFGCAAFSPIETAGGEK